jgi:phenylacetate-CoA ligase
MGRHVRLASGRSIRGADVLGAAWWLARGRGKSRVPLQAIRRLQERRLRSLVAHAFAEVPFQRRRLASAGLLPDAVRTLDDLPRVPTTPKSALRETPPEELVARGIDPTRCDVVRTSGSTGSPLRVFRGGREIDWHRAAALRILLERGFRWTDRTLEIRAAFGPTFAVQRLGLAPKRWVSILDPPADQLRALVGYRPQVLCASASTLHDLALEALGEERALRLRLVISDAEPLLPDTRQLVAKAFGVEPVDVYGLVELSNFAWECERRTGLHVSADTHVVEVLGDDGRPLAPGTPGRIVCTDLVARAMPMLRYETGDWGALVDEPCSCGRTFPRLVGLVGREGDAVLLPNGRRLHWPWFHESFARFDDLERYQVIQEAPDRLRVRLLARDDRWGGLAASVRAELARQVPAEVRVELERWQDRPDEPGRKFRPVLSRLPRELRPRS